MSANIKASVDGTQAIIGVGGVDQMTVSNAGVVTANSFVGAVSSATALATGSTTARTLANRFADNVIPDDFGNTTWPNDSAPAFQAAIASALSQNKALQIPSGKTYNITSPLTLPENLSVIYNGAKRLFGAGPITDESGYMAFGRGKIDAFPKNIQGLDVRINKSTSRPPSGVGWTAHNYFYVNDQVDSRDQPTPWVYGLNLLNEFGNGNTAGARAGIISQLHQYGPIALDSQYDGHTSVVGEVKVFASEGTLASPRGSYFGFNSFVSLENAGIGVFNLSGGEINLNTKTGTSVVFRSGLQMAAYGTVRGTGDDAAVAIANVGGGVDNTVTWKHGILCGRMNGRHAFDGDSIAFAVDGGAVLHGIDFLTYTAGREINPCNIQGDLIRSAKFTVKHGDLAIGNAGIEHGSKTMTSTPYFDFYTNNSGFKSARIISQTINPVDSGGSLNFQASLVTSQEFAPGQNNTYNLGIAGLRWKEVFAVNGVINTSDGRNKEQVRTLSDKEKLVATKLKSLIRAYKWKDAVESKGDKARVHFGIIAQDVKIAFEEEGINADEYGIFCYDEWDAVEDTKDENGEILIKGRLAGNSYGVRYNELAMFILANI